MDSTTTSAADRRIAHRRVGAGAIAAFLVLLLASAVHSAADGDPAVPATVRTTPSTVEPAPAQPPQVVPGDPDPGFDRDGDGRFGGGERRGGGLPDGGDPPGGGAAPAPSTSGGAAT